MYQNDYLEGEVKFEIPRGTGLCFTLCYSYYSWADSVTAVALSNTSM